ncbi:MAG: 16S rRNA (uracil(1498)-N(3))-methyltransferase [Desulfovibrionaceae bacterium]|nr:16S rRNA (uracil(1498)-N(3))-methyltransferase [Desulfovibrionaceae bacterium]
MSSLPCFYLPPSWSEEVLLTGQEAHHLQKVLRLKVGDLVTLIDGQGSQGDFEILAQNSKGVRLKVQSQKTLPKPSSCPIMALALSKAVRRGFFMEKAVELGAGGIWLWQGDQSQGKLGDNLKETCQRQMIAGAKQSRNPWLPEIQVFSGGLKELIKEASAIQQRVLPWELESTVNLITPNLLGREGKTLYVIGPEGGFSKAELDLLEEEHFVKVSLGGRILRCETAAVLCLGLHFWASHLAKQD